MWIGSNKAEKKESRNLTSGAVGREEREMKKTLSTGRQCSQSYPEPRLFSLFCLVCQMLLAEILFFQSPKESIPRDSCVERCGGKVKSLPLGAQ